MGRNVWRRIDREGANKDETYALMGKLREAVIKAEGGRLYGVEIFFIESCVYLMTLYDLLCSGIDTWLVYDAFYSKGFEDQDKFEEMIINSVKSNFEDFLRFYKEKIDLNWVAVEFLFIALLCILLAIFK